MLKPAENRSQVGASLFLVLSHACLIEPGVESEYGAVEEGGV